MQRKVLFYLTNINYKLRNKDQVMNMIILDDQKGKLSSMFAFAISGVESLYYSYNHTCLSEWKVILFCDLCRWHRKIFCFKVRISLYGKTKFPSLMYLKNFDFISFSDHS